MLRVLAALCAVAACFYFGGSPAGATGTITIRHYSGKTNVYNRVGIKIIHSALFLTSEDGKGTIVVHRAACSYQGKLLVCYPTSATLVQAGKASPIALKAGTVYLNDTDDPQPLVLSSAKIPSHSVMLSFTTDRGSYITLNGRIDGVVK